jgi:hypothetical protein
VGPLQAQNWAAPPVAIWARTRRPADLAADLEQRRLVYGFLLRGTLHLVSARQFAAYAAVSEGAGGGGWQELRQALFGFATRPRTAAELTEFIEAWISEHKREVDTAELARQRQYEWRPLRRWSGLARFPEDGRWGRRPPLAQVAAPVPPDQWPAPEAALSEVITWHLRAFGPAAPDDVAQWIGWKTPPVRAAMLAMELEPFQDEQGRKLYDLADAPRPDPDLRAPPRLLPWFDNVILAYAPSQRTRILPDEYKDRVYRRANLQWLPTILVDGMVAGTWAPKSGLNPFTKLPRPVLAVLEQLLAECPA